MSGLGEKLGLFPGRNFPAASGIIICMKTNLSFANPTGIETELLDALQTKNIRITPEDLKGRSLVAVLREKLARSCST